MNPPTIVVYGDFNCPFSALASERADRLEAQGAARIDWRAVEHDPATPDRGEALEGERREELAGELDTVRGLRRPGEEDRLRLPSRRPNTRLATQAYAAAADVDRPALRARVFAAYWGEDRDIADPSVLEALAGTARDEVTAERWHREWTELTEPIVPVIVLPDGYVSRGLGALERLARRLEDTG